MAFTDISFDFCEYACIRSNVLSQVNRIIISLERKGSADRGRYIQGRKYLCSCTSSFIQCDNQEWESSTDTQNSADLEPSNQKMIGVK